jgi:hydrogenase nickel incorporation protein HypA/HybF
VHEFSMTSWIVDALLDLARKQQSKQVLEVHLRIGKLRVLSVDQVKFCYGILTKGTVLEGSNLIVEEPPGKVRCGNCGYSGEFDPEGDAYHFGIPPLICPVCGGSLVIEGGDECVITRVRMQLPSETRPTASIP